MPKRHPTALGSGRLPTGNYKSKKRRGWGTGAKLRRKCNERGIPIEWYQKSKTAEHFKQEMDPSVREKFPLVLAKKLLALLILRLILSSAG